MRLLLVKLEIITLFLMSSLLLGQDTPRRKPLLDPAMPGAYVTLVRTGLQRTDEEVEQRIWLRLHNNYTTPISIESFPVGGEQTFVQDRTREIGVVYGIQPNWKECDTTHLFPNITGHVFTVITMQPGESVLFSVPADSLPTCGYIQIPFNITEETLANKRVAVPQHFAVFYGVSLTRHGVPKGGGAQRH